MLGNKAAAEKRMLDDPVEHRRAHRSDTVLFHLAVGFCLKDAVATVQTRGT